MLFKAKSFDRSSNKSHRENFPTSALGCDVNKYSVALMALCTAAALSFAAPSFSEEALLESDAIPEDSIGAVETPETASAQPAIEFPDGFEESAQFILQNPSVLGQIVEAYRAQEAYANAQVAAQKISENFDAIFSSDGAPIIGNPDGSVVLTLITDSACKTCQEQQRVLEDFAAAHEDVKIIVKEAPLVSESSGPASQFALAAFQDQGLEGYNRAKLAASLIQEWNADSIQMISTVMGVDPIRTVEKMQSEDVISYLTKNMELAKALKLEILPTLISSDGLVSGLVPLEELEAYHKNLDADQ